MNRVVHLSITESIVLVAFHRPLILYRTDTEWMITANRHPIRCSLHITTSEGQKKHVLVLIAFYIYSNQFRLQYKWNKSLWNIFGRAFISSKIPSNVKYFIEKNQNLSLKFTGCFVCFFCSQFCFVSRKSRPCTLCRHTAVTAFVPLNRYDRGIRWRKMPTRTVC